MKRFLSLLPVAVILAAASLLYALPAHAQQQVIYCNAATLSACNTTTNPGNGSQGDVAWLAFGKTNANLAQLYGMWPSGLGILFNTGPIPSPMTAILPSATGTWCFNWSSLAAPPSLVPCAGGGNVSTSGTISTYGIPYWATGTTIASLLPGSTGYYCLYWSSLTGAPALSSSSSCPGGTGSMTWPSAAGIPNYSGSSSWGTSYSASNTIPADFISTLNQNTTGTAANLSGTPALPNGTTATTQTTGDNTTKLATDAFVLANAASAGVSSVAAGSGIAVTGTGSGPYTGAVTVSESYTVRVVMGTTDTILSTDCANGVEYTSSSAVAISLPQATGSFASCSVDIINNGTGTDTVTPTTSTINGGSSFAVLPGRSANITAGNGNYIAAGPAVVPTTGSGNAVLATSPSLVTPALGTPSAINLTNAAAGSLPLTAVAPIANDTVMANVSGSSAAPVAVAAVTYLIDTGTTFTVASGTGTCATTSTLTGGTAVGSVKCTGTSGASTVVVTLPTAPHGWVCEGNDLTTTTDSVHQTASSTTSCTLSGTLVANDVINFMAAGF